MADDLRAWFPLYVADMLNSRKVRKMQSEEFGIFMFLLIEQWHGGPLPDDQRDLCEMGRSDWPAVQKILQAQFVLKDKGWVNERLVEIWMEQKGKRHAASRAGKIGAEARWGKKKPVVTEESSDRNATVLPPDSDRNATPMALEESRGEESRKEESIRAKKKHDGVPGMILIRWDLLTAGKRGYKKITREYFDDVMFVCKDGVPWQENLVIETQEELEAWTA